MANNSHADSGARPAANGNAVSKPKSSFNLLQMLIVLGLLLLITGSFFCAYYMDVSFFFWLCATLLPYAGLLFLCLCCGGLPKFLRSRAGGIVLLVTFVALHILATLIAIVLMILFGIALLFIILNIVGIFAPDGSVTVTGRRSDGSTYTETRYYRGDSKSASEQLEHEFKEQGFRDIEKNETNFGGGK